MFVVFSALPLGKKYPKSIFIEEPEAHLFPNAQKEVVDLLSLIYARTSNEFFITTHSPYILSALNILITGGEADKDELQDKARQVLGDACPVKYEDVSAYAIDHGNAVSILTDEERLIGTNIIDDVSDVFASQLDQLLDLIYPA